MVDIAVQITRYIDHCQPGIVECALVDALGQSHTFIEKAPVVSRENLVSTSAYPSLGSLRGEVVAEWTDEAGRALARVSTERPWGIESTAGLTEFVVLSSDLISQDHRKAT